MWALIKKLLLRWALLRVLLKSVGSIAVLLAVAFVLPFVIILPIGLGIVALVLLFRWLSKRPFRPGTDPL